MQQDKNYLKTRRVKQPVLIIGFSLLATILWSDCKHGKAEDSEKITYVLSDTMLKNTRIDTARLEPVRNEICLTGKITPNGDEMLKDDDKKIVVPSTSVISDNNKNYVLVFKDKFNITIRQVEVAKTTGDITYLSSGLAAGEKVISKNQCLIYNALQN